MFQGDLNATGWKGVDWVPLVENKDQWQSLLDMAMNLAFQNR
jgi:hypothetical protein